MPYASKERRREAERAKRAADPEAAKAKFAENYRKYKESILASAKVRYAANKEKEQARSRKYRVDNPEQVAQTARRQTLKAYGLTVEEYEALLKKQDGKCANTACRTSEPGGTGRFAVDHDHKTGKVRGLLCSGCNTMLGLGRDDPAILRGGAEYLEAHLRSQKTFVELLDSGEVSW